MFTFLLRQVFKSADLGNARGYVSEVINNGIKEYAFHNRIKPNDF
jgi:hypothetical protein